MKATERARLPAPAPPAQPLVHVVQRGQSLWSIARAYGVDLDALVSANAIADRDRVAAGMHLFIPTAGSVSPAATVEALPRDWAWPVRGGTVLAPFGEPRRTHRHQGLDIDGRPGAPIVAAQAGRVVYAGSTMRGYGKTVILDHGDGLRSLYAHNRDLLVATGEQVQQGQRIARVGRSGNATTAHCHFEVRLHEVPVDPLRYLAAGVAENEPPK
jgi:murein DD-endopeptidase MepM/ murein hydrolase activator NlpD